MENHRRNLAGFIVNILLPRMRLVLLAGLVAGPLWAGNEPVPASGESEDDPALGMTRALNIEEAWVENAAYVFAMTDNSLAAGRTVELEGEADFAFSDRVGGEVDFPQVMLRQPLGHAASMLGPVALGLRYVPVRFGTANSGSAGLAAIELEGALAPATSPSFPDVGNSGTAEVLGGIRYGRLSVQGLYGVTRAVGHAGTSGWFANTSLAVHLGPAFSPQVEVDFGGDLPADDRAGAIRSAFIPELGYQTGAWTLEAGMEVGATWDQSVSILMVERDL